MGTCRKSADIEPELRSSMLDYVLRSMDWMKASSPKTARGADFSVSTKRKSI
jgi:hypothetical protein